MYSYALGAIVDILELLLFFLGVYYLGIAVFSLFGRGRNAKEKREYRYAVIIPARNEERTIASLIKSIRQADYPQDKISILVVADGCSDNTATEARLCGAEVLVRDHSVSKGEALKEAFSHISNTDADCIAVFDADNLAGRGFFAEMSERISLGYHAVQGYIDSKNPEASWVSYAYSVWYWITNRTSQAGRARLNLGCRLGGTGFVLTRELLSQVEWNTTTMAEDSEYTCALAESGINVDFCERAVVYDEKPTSFKTSVRQRVRWAQGICDVQGEYTPRLLKKFKINVLLGLWGEVLSTMSFMVLLLSYIFKVGSIWQTTAGGIVLWVYITAYVLAGVLALIKDKKFELKIILNFFGFLIYILSWIPIGITGLFGKRNSWYHTEHSDIV